MESPGDVVLRELVHQYCSSFLFDNARFFAERLYYGNPNCSPQIRSEYLFLLAKCYHGEGKNQQVYHLLKEDNYLPNRYLFAKSCISLSKYPEAERALYPFNNLHPRDLTEERLMYIPGGGSGLYLLGEICRLEQRKEYAIEFYQQAIKFDRNCWVALSALCEMGCNIDTEKLFQMQMSTSLECVRGIQKPLASSNCFHAAAKNERDSNLNASHGPHHNVAGDVLKFQRGHVMERRHIAENLGDPSHTPPHTAMSLGEMLSAILKNIDNDFLGLSSLALRVGFATPGCMPSPQRLHPATIGSNALTADVRSVENYISSFSNSSHIAPLSAMAGGGNDARFGSRSTANNLFSSPSDAPQENSINVAQHCRPIGFFDTPGLTPINSRRCSVDGGEMGLNESCFPMSYDRASTNSSGLSIPPPPPTDNADIERRANTQRERRVSFGPSVVESPPPLREGKQKKNVAARLSFSSAGIGISDDPHESNGQNDYCHNPPPEKFQRIKEGNDSDYKTPYQHMQSSELQQSTLESPQQLAKKLYDRVQSQCDSRSAQNNATSGSVNAEPKPSSTVPASFTRKTSKSANKASKIPVPSGRRVSRESVSPTPRVEVKPSSGKNVAGSDASRRANGRSDYQDGTTESSEMLSKACWDAGQRVVSGIMSVFGHAYYLLCQFRCTDCICHLQELPRKHYSSGWVQHVLGKAYFELNDYKAAQLALQEMLRLEPYRVKGTEILSTTLWHLKREKELCALAQQVTEIDKYSPETWCVVGNCFSLQKEHDTALKFFARSIQLNPAFTYAHTLSGHEYICNEDLDKAQASFRDALFQDDRHYNAWYGLGTIYLRQERFELAEYHFKRAISINSSSSVLQTYLGVVLNAYDRLDKNNEAIMVLRQACKYDTRNSMLYFQLAHVLLKNGSQQHLEDALSALYVVKEYAPKEPPVYSTLGEVCYKLGRNSEALKYFNMAIDLDHKQAVMLKPILDAIQDPFLRSS